jgi:4'-phosphopantetheinyl transferase
MHLHLADSEAHVWVLPLDAAGRREEALFPLLAPGEKARARRCLDRAEQRRFTLGRGTLRILLSRYTGAEPGAIPLRAGPTGKPLLGTGEGLHFSVSHSREVAVMAFARREVGVDVEHQRAPGRMQAIARRILHPDSCALLESLEGDARAAAFLDAWTLREAHVKAVGGGLFRTPDTLPFTPGDAADGSPRPVPQRDGAATWSVARFAPAAGLRATLVAADTIATLRVHDAAATLVLLEESTR